MSKEKLPDRSKSSAMPLEEAQEIIRSTLGGLRE
jgi:hypothetical protein